MEMKMNYLGVASFVGVVLLFAASASSDSSFADQVQVDDLISSLTVDGDNDVAGPLLTRKVRQAPSPPPTTKPPGPKPDLNWADDVSEDYPVVFNIILFLAIALILALIAISVSLATMDPGRDSLIYRVTSAQRFKKDN